MNNFIIIFLCILTFIFIISSVGYLFATDYNPNELPVEIWQEGEHDI